MTPEEALAQLREIFAEEESDNPCTWHLHYCTQCDRVVPCRKHPDAEVRCGEVI